MDDEYHTQESDTQYESPNEADDALQYDHVQNKMNEDIRRIWDNIILPYIENTNDGEILDKLSRNDYLVFHEFMTKHTQLNQINHIVYFSQN